MKPGPQGAWALFFALQSSLRPSKYITSNNAAAEVLWCCFTHQSTSTFSNGIEVVKDKLLYTLPSLGILKKNLGINCKNTYITKKYFF